MLWDPSTPPVRTRTGETQLRVKTQVCIGLGVPSKQAQKPAHVLHCRSWVPVYPYKGQKAVACSQTGLKGMRWAGLGWGGLG